MAYSFGSASDCNDPDDANRRKPTIDDCRFIVNVIVMVQNGYTKLFSSIIDSTIWREDKETKIVWITLLAKCNKYGIVEASIPGLADAARVTLEECEKALALMMSPDKYSRTKEFDGRRIKEVDGGWLILNHAKYRAKMNQEDKLERDRIYQKNKREKIKRPFPKSTPMTNETLYERAVDREDGSENSLVDT